ncbi:MAG: cysteine--tRNA ligase [Fimbriimonadales bacterium]|nr:cysteine--tRNA ligase [Fimbriimonadales bacterium]
MSEPVLRLSDTMTNRIRPVEPVQRGHFRFYSCGPTVYSYAHIGNFRTFLTADLLVRACERLGWKVSYVSNITDVGHLTQDDMADAAGEDKMARALRSKEGERFANIWDLAEHYAEAFKADWTRMNLRKPLVWPKATQHMREQILAIEKLIETGHAYETPTGVYFDVSSFPEYGKLSNNRDQDRLLRAVRNIVTDENKRHPADFALWKKDDKHLMQWFSPWGWGFPGWHIECSVMAMQYLGETIDLHAGGEDLIFPHHECEIAQSESLTGKPFALTWIHTRFLQVDGEKMSKSKGNFYTVRDLVDGERVDPLALRYALITVPYGKPLNFTRQTLRDAGQNVDRFRECARLAEAAKARRAPGSTAVFAESLQRLARELLEAMCDDLNTSVALAKALGGTSVIFKAGDAMTAEDGAAALAFLDEVQALLGIVRPEHEGVQAPTGPRVDEERIEALIAERAAAKKARDYAKADAIRAQLEKEGIELRDTPDGTHWRVRSAP